MSTLQNEVLLENIYEELMAELIDTGNLAMMTESEINHEVMCRFQDLSLYTYLTLLFFYYAYTSTNTI